MSTLKHRTINREGFIWTVEVQEVRTHGRAEREALILRNGENWATAQKHHNGQFMLVPVSEGKVIPDSVLVEVKRDLGVLNG